MAKYLIEIEVNEDKLRRFEGIDVGEENAYEETIDSLIAQEMAWVEESGIYVTEIKEVSEELSDLSWDFVEKFYPNYYSSDEIAKANDLDMILTEPDTEWNEGANRIWLYEAEEDMYNVACIQDEVMSNVYRKAIEGYLESIKEK